MRTACVIVPRLAVQLALQQRPDLVGQPVIVGDDLADRRVVVDASPQARACGITPGMPLRQAIGRCSLATVVPIAATLRRGAVAALQRLLNRFSPTVQAVPPETFLLDVGGVTLTMLGRDGPPTEAALLTALLADLEQQTGLHARVGVGAGTFVARMAAVLAHDGGVCTIAPGEEQTALAHTPVEALPCSVESGRRLRLYGLRTLAEFTALPFGPVQAQFGAEGARLWRLACGYEIDRPRADVSPASLSEQLDLPAPTADSALLVHAADLLLRRLFRSRERANQHARRLTITIPLENGVTWERTHTFRTPIADTARALAAVRPRLEALEIPAAASAIVCTLHDLCGERAQQGNLFSDKARQLAQLDEELRQLRARLGVLPILRIVAVEPHSRLPERRYALTEYVV